MLSVKQEISVSFILCQMTSTSVPVIITSLYLCSRPLLNYIYSISLITNEHIAVSNNCIFTVNLMKSLRENILS